VETETMPVEVQAERAAAFAKGLLDAMEIDARVEADVNEDDVLVRIEGENLGVLVGPRGATLHALEELVRAVIQHTSEGHSARVHVDVAGYRERRRAALAAFAEQVAAEVRESGTERALEPMPPPDRKVVHDALTEVEGVTTGSEGEEPRRRVVIRPA
jgi:spoIIIJ-associated protein